MTDTLTLTPEQRQILELRVALNLMLCAVCGETGFAAAVRADSGLAYPWPALDIAEAQAHRALNPGETLSEEDFPDE